MPKAPIIYKSTHRIKFSELDPYDHVNTGNYATYYVDHRMEGLRDYAGWDLKTLGTLPFMVGPEDRDRLSTASQWRSGNHDHVVRARVPRLRYAHRVHHDRFCR